MATWSKPHPLRLVSLYLFTLFTPLICSSQIPDVDASWTPIFTDSFNTFDSTRWYKSHLATHGDGIEEEPQVYYSSNASIITEPTTGDKQLLLSASRLTRPIPHPNNGTSCQYQGKHLYKSGQIISTEKYQYGLFEIKAKVPHGVGFWPAFWLFDCDDAPNGFYNEIDIMEIVNGWNDTTSSNIHWGNCCNDVSPDTMHYHLIDNNHAFHWYRLEWTRTRLIWFVDEQIVRVDSNNYGHLGIHHPMEIIINLAISPHNLGPINDYPGSFVISQANVFTMQSDTNTDVTIIPDFSNYSYAIKRTITLSSTTTIPANATISLRAKEYIELKDGFEVPAGAQIYLEAGAYN